MFTIQQRINRKKRTLHVVPLEPESENLAAVVVYLDDEYFIGSMAFDAEINEKTDEEMQFVLFRLKGLIFDGDVEFRERISDEDATNLRELLSQMYQLDEKMREMK